MVKLKVKTHKQVRRREHYIRKRPPTWSRVNKAYFHKISFVSSPTLTLRYLWFSVCIFSGFCIFFNQNLDFIWQKKTGKKAKVSSFVWTHTSIFSLLAYFLFGPPDSCLGGTDSIDEKSLSNACILFFVNLSGETLFETRQCLIFETSLSKVLYSKQRFALKRWSKFPYKQKINLSALYYQGAKFLNDCLPLMNRSKFTDRSFFLNFNTKFDRKYWFIYNIW